MREGEKEGGEGEGKRKEGGAVMSHI